MTSLTSLLKDNRQALWFVGKFIGFYLLLNVAYGLYIESYYPNVDPMTSVVSQNVSLLLSLFHGDISILLMDGSPYIPVMLKGTTVINVFEGCNSINVIIVFVVFVTAFSAQWYRYWKFIAIGAVIIYVMNLIRVMVLFWIALYSPDSLYFFHKFLFTGAIYAVVFVLWFWWVRSIKRS